MAVDGQHPKMIILPLLRARSLDEPGAGMERTPTMKAAVFDRYGPPEVLHLADVAKPVPGDDEVLVRVRTTTVCAGDVRLRRAAPFFLRAYSGLFRPSKINILGMEFAGAVESIGKRVTLFDRGDEVFGSTGLKFGACAEYVCVSEGPLLARRPLKATPEQAVAIPYGGVSALHFLKAAGVRPGHRVLVYGASGSVGTFAVQLAKHFGAQVTAVCSTANVDLVRALGADNVVDYTKEDFSARGPTYDIVFDTVGKSGFWRSLKALKRGGAYVRSASGLLSPTLGRAWASLVGAGRVIQGMARTRAGDLSFLIELVEAGRLRPVIDRTYPLGSIAEAHRLAESGHKKGAVVITVA
jgi:NADPH:quinone reductase-like Zn-dependent oxidoreductase